MNQKKCSAYLTARHFFYVFSMTNLGNETYVHRTCQSVHCVQPGMTILCVLWLLRSSRDFHSELKVLLLGWWEA